MKRTLSLWLVLALILSGASPLYFTAEAEAAAKPALSAKTKTITVGKSFTLTMKNTKKTVAWSVKSGASYVTLSSKKKQSVVVKGKKAGTAVVQGKIGKAAYTCKVTVKPKPAVFTENDVQYTVSSGVLTKVRVGKNVRTVVIPSNLKITALGKKVFENNHYIKQVVIPEGVTEIRDNAFNECTDLKRITLPSTLQTIGDNAFFQCVALKKISTFSEGESDDILPTSITAIGDGAFYDCDSLTSVNIGSNIQSLGEYAFGACDILDTAVIGAPASDEDIDPSADPLPEEDDYNDYPIPELTAGLTELPDQCFQSCPMLEVVALNREITRIGNRAFEGDERLTNLSLPGMLTEISLRAFANSGLQQVTFPENLKTVGSGAFANTPITSVTIPASVTALDAGAFAESQLTAYTVEAGNTKYRADSGVLYSKDGTILYHYPVMRESGSYRVLSGTEQIADAAFLGAVELKTLTLPYGLRTIGAFAFKDTTLPALTIPNTVSSIGNEAFSGNDVITSINVPDSVTSLGDSVFAQCTSLKTAAIGSGVTAYPWMLFANCRSLSNFKIGRNVTAIDPSAFYHCSGIGSFSAITFEAGSPFAAADDGSLISEHGTVYAAYPGFEQPEDSETGEASSEEAPYRIPDGIKLIRSNAFYSADHVSTIIVPDSVETVEKNAFGFNAAGRMTGAAIICGKDSAAAAYARANDIAGFDSAIVGSTLPSSEQTRSLKAGLSTSFPVRGLLTPAYYSTSNSKIATVSSKGTIKGVGSGTTSVICTSGTKNLICRVTVTGGTPGADTPIPYLPGYTFLTYPNYRQWLDKYEDYNRGLSLDERDYPATYVYSTNDYPYIKGAILGPDSSYFKAKVAPELGDDYHQYDQVAENLSMELRQAKLHKNTVIYSGTGDVSGFTNDYNRQGLSDLKQIVGKTLKFNNVTSTSVNHAVCVGFAGNGAYATMLEFYAPKDKTPGTYISQFSAFSSEKELLLDKDVNLKVLDCGYREAYPSSDFNGTRSPEDEMYLERYLKLQIIN